jgi:hypothetical protein
MELAFRGGFIRNGFNEYAGYKGTENQNPELRTSQLNISLERNASLPQKNKKSLDRYDTVS